MLEQWKPIPGYEGLYEVSNLGNARSLARIDAQGGRRRQRAFKPSRMDVKGHLGIKVRRDGVVKSRYVHQLVLEAFVGPCPDGMEACHWNDIPDDNRLENLRWATKSANRYDCIRNGGDHNAKKTHCHRGHPYDSANTYLYGRRRHCRECRCIADAAFKARRSEAQRKAA